MGIPAQNRVQNWIQNVVQNVVRGVEFLVREEATLGGVLPLPCPIPCPSTPALVHTPGTLLYTTLPCRTCTTHSRAEVARRSSLGSEASRSLGEPLPRMTLPKVVTGSSEVLVREDGCRRSKNG